MEIDNIEEVVKVIGKFGVTMEEGMIAFSNYAEIMLMPDGAICEVIDGYDVVLLSESEYADD